MQDNTAVEGNHGFFDDAEKLHESSQKGDKSSPLAQLGDAINRASKERFKGKWPINHFLYFEVEPIASALGISLTDDPKAKPNAIVTDNKKYIRAKKNYKRVAAYLAWLSIYHKDIAEKFCQDTGLTYRQWSGSLPPIVRSTGAVKINANDPNFAAKISEIVRHTSIAIDQMLGQNLKKIDDKITDGIDVLRAAVLGNRRRVLWSTGVILAAIALTAAISAASIDKPIQALNALGTEQAIAQVAPLSTETQIETVKRQLEQTPSQPAVQARLNMQIALLYHLRDPKIGLEFADKAIALTPGDPDAHLLRAELLRIIGDDTEIRSTFQIFDRASFRKAHPTYGWLFDNPWVFFSFPDSSPTTDDANFEETWLAVSAIQNDFLRQTILLRLAVTNAFILGEPNQNKAPRKFLAATDDCRNISNSTLKTRCEFLKVIVALEGAPEDTVLERLASFARFARANGDTFLAAGVDLFRARLLGDTLQRQDAIPLLRSAMTELRQLPFDGPLMEALYESARIYRFVDPKVALESCEEFLNRYLKRAPLTSIGEDALDVCGSVMAVYGDRKRGVEMYALYLSKLRPETRYDKFVAAQKRWFYSNILPADNPERMAQREEAHQGLVTFIDDIFGHPDAAFTDQDGYTDETLRFSARAELSGIRAFAAMIHFHDRNEKWIREHHQNDSNALLIAKAERITDALQILSELQEFDSAHWQEYVFGPRRELLDLARRQKAQSSDASDAIEKMEIMLAHWIREDENSFVRARALLEDQLGGYLKSKSLRRSEFLAYLQDAYLDDLRAALSQDPPSLSTAHFGQMPEEHRPKNWSNFVTFALIRGDDPTSLQIAAYFEAEYFKPTPYADWTNSRIEELLKIYARLVDGSAQGTWTLTPHQITRHREILAALSAMRLQYIDGTRQTARINGTQEHLDALLYAVESHRNAGFYDKSLEFLEAYETLHRSVNGPCTQCNAWKGNLAAARFLPDQPAIN